MRFLRNLVSHDESAPDLSKVAAFSTPLFRRHSPEIRTSSWSATWYASYSLSITKRSYCVTRNQIFAVVFGLRTFQLFLRRCETCCRYLHNFKAKEGRMRHGIAYGLNRTSCEVDSWLHLSTNGLLWFLKKLERWMTNSLHNTTKRAELKRCS